MSRSPGVRGVAPSMALVLPLPSVSEVAIRMEQEPGSSGKIAIAHFRKLLGGFDFKGVPSTGDKVVRSNPFASEAEAGNVKLVRGPWVSEFLREHESFPGGSHDDQVDAASAAYDEHNRGGLSPSDLYGADEEGEAAELESADGDDRWDADGNWKGSA